MCIGCRSLVSQSGPRLVCGDEAPKRSHRSQLVETATGKVEFMAISCQVNHSKTGTSSILLRFYMLIHIHERNDCAKF